MLKVDPGSRLGSYVGGKRRSSSLDPFSEGEEALYSEARKISDLASASYHAGKLSIDGGDFGPSTVDPAEWLIWAMSKDLKIPDELKELAAEALQENERNQPKLNQSLEADRAESLRARRTLLVMIAALCRANNIDYEQKGRCQTDSRTYRRYWRSSPRRYGPEGAEGNSRRRGVKTENLIRFLLYLIRPPPSPIHFKY